MKKKIQAIQVSFKDGESEASLNEHLSIDYEGFTGITILNEDAKDIIIKRTMFDGKEILPKDTETEFIMSSLFVAPDFRFFSLKEFNSNSELEMTFKREDTAGSKVFNVYVRLEK